TVAGIVVGTINGMAGGASIISYPVLLALGLHPLDATVTNAIGTTSANFVAIRSSKYKIWDLIKLYKFLIAISVIGSLIGATLLLAFPPHVFEHIVPFLLLGATLTLLLPTKPAIGRRNEKIETVGIAASGLYCGYFGPGQGVMVIASLARNPKKPDVMNAAKNIIVGIPSAASNVIYLFSGHVHWMLAFALFVGSSIGGALGGRWASRMSPNFYKGLVMVVGIGASIYLFKRYFF
ncbi:MAG TPA: sulfite exporter TauE/SafE family protein, partial [Candidatus Nanopelagicaceae bacterium]